jgi:hypothetical protein
VKSGKVPSDGDIAVADNPGWDLKPIPSTRRA